VSTEVTTTSSSPSVSSVNGLSPATDDRLAGGHTGRVHPVVDLGGRVDAGHHQVDAVEQVDHVVRPGHPPPYRVHRDARVERPHPGRGAVHFGLADVGLAVEELAGEVARLHLVGVQQRDPADAQPDQAGQHVRAEAAGAQLEHVRAEQPLLRLDPTPLQRAEQSEVEQVAVVARVGRDRGAGAGRGLDQADRVERPERLGDLVRVGGEATAGELGGRLRGGARRRGEDLQQRGHVTVRVGQPRVRPGVAEHDQVLTAALPPAGLQPHPHQLPPRGGSMVPAAPPPRPSWGGRTPPRSGVRRRRLHGRLHRLDLADDDLLHSRSPSPYAGDADRASLRPQRCPREVADTAFVPNAEIRGGGGGPARRRATAVDQESAPFGGFIVDFTGSTLRMTIFRIDITPSLAPPRG
jgi:hypothetical protein